MNKKTLQGIVFIALAVVGVGFSIFQSRGEESVVSAKRPDAILNETLTNSSCADSLLFPLDSSVAVFMKRYKIHGASMAVMKNDSLVYVQGYGEADDGVPMEARTLLRVASVSKLITASGIMKLVEDGALSLDDTVFGEGDILEDLLQQKKNSWYKRITIRHLLKHEAGLSCRMGFDPMFSTENLMRAYNLKKAPRRDELAKIVLRYRLAFQPGTSSEYSNVGYLLLSLIIERITGEDYFTWINDNILLPAGCYDFHPISNSYCDKQPYESRYYVPEDTGNDYEALLGSGGWVCSAPELMRFVASIDDRDEIPNVLSDASILDMTVTTDSLSYGLGWIDISEEGTWTRTGTLTGTNAIVQKFADGECWIFITNTDSIIPRFNKRIASFIKRSREDFSALLPKRDLFHL